MKLTPKFRDAFELAFEFHRDQVRKQNPDVDPADGIPYMGHILGVAAIVIDAGGSENEVIAALLHDGPEDSGGREALDRVGREFGEEVKRIVEALSDTFEQQKPAWGPRKERYLQSLRELPDDPLAAKELTTKILRVSLADKLHNARSIIFDRRTVGEAVWDRFTASKEESLWYYRTLAGIYADRLGPDEPLVEEYQEALKLLSGERSSEPA